MHTIIYYIQTSKFTGLQNLFIYTTDLCCTIEWKHETALSLFITITMLVPPMKWSTYIKYIVQWRLRHSRIKVDKYKCLYYKDSIKQHAVIVNCVYSPLYYTKIGFPHSIIEAQMVCSCATSVTQAITCTCSMLYDKFWTKYLKYVGGTTFKDDKLSSLSHKFYYPHLHTYLYC